MVGSGVFPDLPSTQQGEKTDLVSQSIVHLLILIV